MTMWANLDVRPACVRRGFVSRVQSLDSDIVSGERAVWLRQFRHDWRGRQLFGDLSRLVRLIGSTHPYIG